MSQPEQLNSAAGSVAAPGETFFIKTFGCQMNVADTERMHALLADQGMKPAADPTQAQVIIINGCTVREKAVHKALSQLGHWQELKANKEGIKATRPPIIGIGGCVGQLDKENLFKHAPYIDFVFGTDTIDHLPEIVYRVKNGERHVVFADFDKTADYSTETRVSAQRAQAFVNIMKGCDKYCTYCIVPFTRGREKSRTIDEVVDDVARLVATGVREVTLLGQNVNSFGKGNANVKGREPQELHNIIGKVGPRAGEENFPQLLRALDSDPRLARLQRIRFTSSHPLDFSDELIECYRPASQGGVAKLAPHLHLPVQSGSNRVLQKMGRHHQIEGYIAQMDRLRELNPEVGLSTDLIVGFPGETEAEFEETLKLLDRVQYDSIYAFAYSPRPGTRAAKLVDDVSTADKRRRLNALLAHELSIAEKRYRAKVGRPMEILVEGRSKNSNLIKYRKSGGAAEAGADLQIWTGRTGCNRVVNFTAEGGRDLTGRFVQVQITSASSLALQGEAVHEPFAAETAETADGLTRTLAAPVESEVVG